jgi:hypothetical protein
MLAARPVMGGFRLSEWFAFLSFGQRGNSPGHFITAAQPVRPYFGEKDIGAMNL